LRPSNPPTGISPCRNNHISIVFFFNFIYRLLPTHH
jgi:hypothetical protein